MLAQAINPLVATGSSVVDPDPDPDPDPRGSETFCRIRIRKNHFGSGSGRARIRNEILTGNSSNIGLISAGNSDNTESSSAQETATIQRAHQHMKLGQYIGLIITGNSDNRESSSALNSDST